MVATAGQGNVRARNILGEMYLWGRDGFDQDAVKAFIYFNSVVSAWVVSGRREHEFDAAFAMHRLGELMSEMREYDPDSGARAHSYFAVAARLGHKEAAKRRDAIVETLTVEETTQGRIWADELYPHE